jgi:hypothetical protein
LHDLTILAPAAAGLTTADALTALETEAVLEFAQAAKSRASLRAYASDWQDFRAWCAARGATALPATPALVCGYISTLAHGGLKASTLGRRIAAIAHVHSQHGHKPPPTADETVRVVMKGIRRTLGTAPDPGQPRHPRPVAGRVPRHPDRQARPRLARPGLRRSVPAFRAGGSQCRRSH